MSPRDFAWGYNNLARFLGWELLHPVDSPYESNKEYRPLKRVILPFLFRQDYLLLECQYCLENYSKPNH